MKTIGLLGGMSWQSTQSYYRAINEGVAVALGGLHSAQIVMVSVDFAPIERLQAAGDWPAAAVVLSGAARQLQLAGADAMMICTNTMHKLVPEIEQEISIPILHIADATGQMLVDGGYQKVALLGTAFTMEQTFYTGRLSEKFGLDVMIPDTADRQIIHDIIYQELCRGQVNPASHRQYVRIVKGLREAGAEAVILGCTEIGLLLKQIDTDVMLVDTTEIHAQCAVEFLLS